MRAIVALCALATGAAALAAAGFYPGPARAGQPFSLAQRVAALRINRGIELSDDQAKKIKMEVRLDSSLAKLKVIGVRERPFSLECRRADGADDLGLIAKKTLREGIRPAFCDERDQAAGDLRFFEIDHNVRAICPGQYSGVTEEQVHDALFLPALVSTRAGKKRAVLEQGRLPGDCGKDGKNCDCGPNETNCVVSRGPPSLVYCGNIRACTPGRADSACFSGTARIRPADVAASLYYYRALVMAPKPSDVSVPECGPTQTSLYRSSLVSEVVTSETVENFIRSGALDDSRMKLAFARPDGVPFIENPLYQRLRQLLAGNESGVCFVLQQFDERITGAAMIEQALSFPVFAPFDAADDGHSRASPLLRGLQNAVASTEKMSALFGKSCELEASKCGAQLERISTQLKAALGNTSPALGSLSAAELPLHVAGSGTFKVSDYDPDSRLKLASWNKAPGSDRPLIAQIERLWPEAVGDQRAACRQDGKSCYFRNLWTKESASDARLQPRRAEDRAVFSLVGLFGRASEANARCVRRLYTALGSAAESDVRKLQASLRAKLTGEVTRADVCPWPDDVRRATGLTPSLTPIKGCKPPQATFKETPGSCETIDLAFVNSEPWANAAQAIVEIAGRAGVPVRARGVSAAVARSREGGTWDVLLTVASNYFSRDYPTLLALLDLAGSQHLSQGDAYSPEGKKLLQGYEAKVVTPPPPLFSAALPEEISLLTREELLHKLEADVAGWRAPILPLAFLDPFTFAINDKGSLEDSLDARLLDRRFAEGEKQ